MAEKINNSTISNADTAAAAENAVDSIKKLMESVGNDDALKQKLADALAALTGKTPGTDDESEKQKTGMEDGKNPEDEDKNTVADDDDGAADDDADDDDTDDDDVSSGSDFSDIFNEDSVAGMVVGFVAGAAVVGGGVLLHKLITNK